MIMWPSGGVIALRERARETIPLRTLRLTDGNAAVRALLIALSERRRAGELSRRGSKAGDTEPHAL